MLSTIINTNKAGQCVLNFLLCCHLNAHDRVHYTQMVGTKITSQNAITNNLNVIHNYKVSLRGFNFTFFFIKYIKSVYICVQISTCVHWFAHINQNDDLFFLYLLILLVSYHI